jgi:hypothetical protein
MKLLLGLLLAHSFYDPWCCSDKDCHPVPCEEMAVRTDGAVEWRGLIFTKVKDAPDAGCHVCTSETPGNRAAYPICAYRPIPIG